MIEKKFRVTLDLTVRIDDITEESIKRDLQDFTNYAEIVQWPDTWEIAERQKRLLAVVVENKELLDVLVKKFLVERLELIAQSELQEALGIEEDEVDLLEPAFSKLIEEDRSFFEEAISKGLFSENAEHYFNSFDAELNKATLTEL